MPGQVPPVSTEREALLGYLAQQRDALRIAAFGLTEEQLRARPTRSALSVGGLLKHCAATERSWMDTVLQRDSGRGVGDYAADFEPAGSDTVASLQDDLDAAGRETAEIVTRIDDLDHPVPVPPAPWNPTDVDAWSLRWVLLHLIEELARHAGHADIVRESVDGATAMELMAAAEGWPATDWLTPWQPPGGAG
jgi:uncharacterized damage-inducible protein DinB